MLQSIVDCARTAIAQGRHDNASLEDIVRAAGAPQEVIGELISSKEQLFRLAVFDCSKDVVDTIFSLQRDADDTPAYLMRFAVVYLGRILQADALRTYRLAAGQAASHPDVTEQFRKNALDGYGRLARVLEKETIIKLPEGFTYLDASHQFHALCRSAVHHLRVFSDDDAPVEVADVVGTARKAVSTFLRAFPLAA